MQSVESVVERVARFFSIREQLSVFIPWVEMQRGTSLGAIERLLNKLEPAAQNGESVWVEPAEPGTAYTEIPPQEVVEGVQNLRWHRRMAARYPDMVMDMTFAHLCAAYDAYFQDYLVSFILACPNCIRSKRQLSYEKILDHLEAGTLLGHLAQREAHEVGYKSFSEQIDFVRDRLGVKVLPPVATLVSLQQAIGIRNLIMHNDGYVNDMFLESVVARNEFSLGQRIVVSVEYWNECKEGFASLVLALAQDLLCRIYKLDRDVVISLLADGVESNATKL